MVTTYFPSKINEGTRRPFNFALAAVTRHVGQDELLPLERIKSLLLSSRADERGRGNAALEAQFNSLRNFVYEKEGEGKKGVNASEADMNKEYARKLKYGIKEIEKAIELLVSIALESDDIKVCRNALRMLFPDCPLSLAKVVEQSKNAQVRRIALELLFEYRHMAASIGNSLLSSIAATSEHQDVQDYLNERNFAPAQAENKENGKAAA